MNPENGTACNNLGSSYYMLGNFQEAARAWEKSVQISPSVASYSNLGTMHFFTRRFEAASRMYQKCIDLAPEDHRGWGNLADAYRFIDGSSEQPSAAYAKALSLAEAEMERNPNDEETLTIQGHYLANLGFADRALNAVSTALEQFGGNPGANYYAAVVYTLLDLHELAMQNIRVAVEQGYPKAMVKADAQFDPLLNEDAFVELINSENPS